MLGSGFILLLIYLIKEILFPSKFYYKFKFGNDILEYEYQKDKPQNLVSEVVKINNKLIY